MNKEKDIKKHNIRKGCFYCSGPLNSFKEKVLRSCNDCASKALEGFDKMAHGKVKEGFNQVLETANLKLKKDTKDIMKKTMKDKEKKIKKKLRKKGLTEEQINSGLDKFKEAVE